MRARRHAPRVADLTSLLDVLFILVFASLIRAAAVQDAAARAAQPAPPTPVPRVPALPADVATLRTHALAALDQQLAARTPLVLRISAAGTLDGLEVDGKRTALDVPLLEHSPNPDVGVSYLGDRSAELRLCQIAALHLGAADLARYLVIIAPARALADLPHALYDGLHRDLDRCFTDQHGLATVVDPTVLPPTATTAPPSAPPPPTPTTPTAPSP